MFFLQPGFIRPSTAPTMLHLFGLVGQSGHVAPQAELQNRSSETSTGHHRLYCSDTPQWQCGCTWSKLQTNTHFEVIGDEKFRSSEKVKYVAEHVAVPINEVVLLETVQHNGFSSIKKTTDPARNKTRTVTQRLLHQIPDKSLERLFVWYIQTSHKALQQLNFDLVKRLKKYWWHIYFSKRDSAGAITSPHPLLYFSQSLVVGGRIDTLLPDILGC